MADLNLVFQNIRVPVISVFRKKPGLGMLETVERIFGLRSRLLIEKSGVVKIFGNLTFYHVGFNEKQAGNVLSSLILNWFPWSLRLVHLIGNGVVLGESKGRI